MTASVPLLLLALAAATGPEAGAATMTVPSAPVPFAAPFPIVIEVRHGSAFLLEDPAIPAPWPVDAAVVRIDPPAGPGPALARIHLQARAFLLGDVAIPPFQVRIRPADGGGPVDLATGSARITVASILPEDAAAPEWISLPPPGRGSNRTPLLLAAAGAAIAGVLAFALAGRARRRAPPPPGPGALELLRRHGAAGAEEPPPHPGELSRLLRTALAARLSRQAPQHTGRELAEAAIPLLGARNASGIADIFDRLDAAAWGGAGLADSESRTIAARAAEILDAPPDGPEAASGTGGGAP